MVSPLLIFVVFNYQNLLLKFSLFLGLMVFPYIVSFQPQKGNYRFAVLTLICGGTLIFLRSSTLYYFMAAFLLFHILEKWWGRIHSLPVLLIVIVSPAINTIVYIWSFPIRLQLTQIVGKLLQAAQFDIQTQGNMIWMEGNRFAVDEACIGLNMVITAMVLSLVLLSYLEKQYQKRISFLMTIPLLISMLLLTIVSNFIRLLTLIIFHILPDNPLHDVVGLLSLAVYALVPFYLLLQFYFQKTDHFLPDASYFYHKGKPVVAPNFHEKAATVLLLALQLVVSPQFLTEKIEPTASVERIDFVQFEKTITPNGILKFQNETALLYIKPPVSFFQGSHDPRFCWNGSGYKFSDIQLKNFNNHLIYTATLSKGTDRLHTAWWYQYQQLQTPYEWTWRWRNLRFGEQFYLVSLSCAKEESLQQWLRHIQSEIQQDANF